MPFPWACVWETAVFRTYLTKHSFWCHVEIYTISYVLYIDSIDSKWPGVAKSGWRKISPINYYVTRVYFSVKRDDVNNQLQDFFEGDVNFVMTWVMCIFLLSIWPFVWMGGLSSTVLYIRSLGPITLQYLTSLTPLFDISPPSNVPNLIFPSPIHPYLTVCPSTLHFTHPQNIFYLLTWFSHLAHARFRNVSMVT